MWEKFLKTLNTCYIIIQIWFASSINGEHMTSWDVISLQTSREKTCQKTTTKMARGTLILRLILQAQSLSEAKGRMGREWNQHGWSSGFLLHTSFVFCKVNWTTFFRSVVGRLLLPGKPTINPSLALLTYVLFWWGMVYIKRAHKQNNRYWPTESPHTVHEVPIHSVEVKSEHLTNAWRIITNLFWQNSKLWTAGKINSDTLFDQMTEKCIGSSCRAILWPTWLILWMPKFMAHKR
jgi:hypothetical protein